VTCAAAVMRYSESNQFNKQENRTLSSIRCKHCSEIFVLENKDNVISTHLLGLLGSVYCIILVGPHVSGRSKKPP
jgi:hypothetical protein